MSLPVCKRKLLNRASPTCGRACAEEDLSSCLRCGQRYCRYDSWECECDRQAAEMVERGTPRYLGLVEKLLARFS